MAYNTTAIKKDVDGKPIPQLYNELLNAYEVLQGRNGASRTELYDAAGNPIDLVQLLQGHSGRNSKACGAKRKHNGVLWKVADIKPTANVIKGSTYFEMDTVEVHMWDGANWVVI